MVFLKKIGIQKTKYGYMLIKLDNGLIEYCDLNSDSPKKVEIFELFADIRKRGYHFITADRKVLEILGGLKGLSERSRRIFQKLFQNYTTEAAIESSLEFKYIIGDFKSEFRNKEVRLNIEELQNNTFLNRNKLLLENSSDTTVYELMANFYIEENSLNEIQYQWDICNGGGSTSLKEFLRISSEKLSYTFCILDSDKISPYADFGSTAKQFLCSSFEKCFGNYLILPVHEMENLFPEEMLDALVHGNLVYSKNRELIHKFKEDKDCDALKYVDLKKGINKYLLYNLNGHCQTYWTSKFKKHGINIKKCSCTNSGCNHYLIHPFGRKVVEDIMKFVAKANLKLEQLLDEAYKKIWLRIGKLLIERFCCPKFMVNF